MALACGSQVVLCDMPVRFDTYGGCSHGCRYCFAQKKWNFTDIEKVTGVKALESFIKGNRTKETAWCDWKIPIHWGGMSDPFQPAERKFRASYECLKLLAETYYPVVISTKGALIADDEYLELLSKCNVVVQISMASSKYDKIEPGCPTFEERLKIVEKISPKVKRVNIRTQPYMPEIFKDYLKNIPRFKAAGAYGVIVEGMKFAKKKEGLVRVSTDYCYPIEILRSDFNVIKSECHKNGLKFYCAENRLRTMGDHMTCCGIDGLEGFKGNEYNICHMMNGTNPQPTEKMKEIGTGQGLKSMNQRAGSYELYQQKSFYGAMMEEMKRKKSHYETVFGLNDK